MEYRNLGSSGLKVSVIGLGCNQFGWLVDEQTSISVIHHALNQGINFLDTADMYGEKHSEEYVGKALKGRRSEVIIATKFGSAIGEGPNDRGGSRYHIMQAVDASLRRLNTDYIDLYQMHRPDPTTPLEETLRALDDLVRTGKVRYIGCSNYSGWRLCEALWTSKANNLASFITIQSEYSLLYRGLEQEVAPCCEAHGVGVIPWGPLTAGVLTGKYRRGEPLPSGTRLDQVTDLRALLNDTNFDILEKLQAFVTEKNHSMAELAIAWLLSHPWLITVIAGATRPEQITANIAAAAWQLSAEEIAEVDSITEICKDRKGFRPVT